MDLLDRMLGHDRWTTTRFLELSQELTDEQFEQPFDIGHRTLRATFGHMISAVGFWTAAMSGQPEEMRENVALHNERHRGEVLHILQRLGVLGLPDGDPQEWEYATEAV